MGQKTAFFKEQEQIYSRLAVSAARTDRLWAGLRIAVFLTGTAAVLWFAEARQGYYFAAAILLTLPAFAFAVNRHAEARRKRRQAEFCRDINRREIPFSEGELPENTGAGSHFSDPTHDYASDLDLFGKKSLFSFFNRTATSGGAEKLADFFLNPAETETARLRQEAVRELAGRPEFLCRFEAEGRHFPKQFSEKDRFNEFFSEPSVFRKFNWLRPLSFALPPLILAVIFSGVFWENVSYAALLLLPLSGLALLTVSESVGRTIQAVSRHKDELSALAVLSEIIENQEFKSGLLEELQKTLQERGKASVQFRRLQEIAERLEMRSNVFFFLAVNVWALWDVHVLFSAEKWKETQAENFPKITDALGRFDALCSLAAVLHARDDFRMPVLSDKTKHFSAEGLGHPLIPAGRRNVNDFSFSGPGLCVLITGSNMSGKSTFLRTVALNSVLAAAGAPVCARQAEISCRRVFTSMRTQDSLEENVSSFYAELRRIGRLIELLKSGEDRLYFLDEILKGTNSGDRHLGAEGLIRQLNSLGAGGFVSTHDLALCRLSETGLPGRLENYSFESLTEGEELVFEYKINKGFCRNFNAVKLMQKVGIEVKVPEDL